MDVTTMLTFPGTLLSAEPRGRSARHTLVTKNAPQPTATQKHQSGSHTHTHTPRLRWQRAINVA